MTRVPPALVDRLRQRAFGVGSPAGPPRIGAEVEFLPVQSDTRRIAAIESTMQALRRLQWIEHRSAKSGLPELVPPSGGRVTFEPGGQVEYASPPVASVSALAANLSSAVQAMRDVLAAEGIDSLFVGIDPVNAIADVPLQVRAPRYTRMDAHFGAIGPHGARMMRQTASVQVSVDAGEQPLERWTLLNAVAPFLSAMFANASTYEGRATDAASVRQLAWRHLDPRRTGLPFDERCPVEAYAAFAFNAPWILGPDESLPFRSFARQSTQHDVGLDAWDEHLTTLFPEVRPRGYFEVRGIDAIDPAWFVVPLVTVAGLALDPAIAREALAVAGQPDPTLLCTAAHAGLADQHLARGAADLSRLALDGAMSLGPAVVSEADLDRTREFFQQFTWSGRAPADGVPASAA